MLILIIENDTVTSNFINEILVVNHYDVMRAATGNEGLAMATSYCPDLVLLELSLPDIDGIEVIKSIRRLVDIPIIVVSSRLHERDKVQALDLGADDYITKPFGVSELLARIRTAIRHNKNNNEFIMHEDESISIGGLTIDNRKRIVIIEGKEVRLTPVEFKIVQLLSKHAGKVLTHEFIIKHVWGNFIYDNQILRVNITNIRKKIEADHTKPKIILTDSGIGYMMSEI